jgi:hypothetical protein
MWALRAWDERESFLRSYYAWRHDAPVINAIILVLVLLLPFVIYGMVVEDVMGLWRRPLHRKRHLIGSVGLAALVGVVAYSIALQRPAEEALIALPKLVATGTATASLALAQSLEAGTRAYRFHVISALANAAMMLLPFFKHAAAAEGARAAAAAMHEDAPGKDGKDGKDVSKDSSSSSSPLSGTASSAPLSSGEARHRR